MVSLKIDEITLEEEARTLEYCLACYNSKGLNELVCWNCFKYRTNNLKNSSLSFTAWLKVVRSTSNST